jgi:hypothetical protein
MVDKIFLVKDSFGDGFREHEDFGSFKSVELSAEEIELLKRWGDESRTNTQPKDMDYRRECDKLLRKLNAI